MKNTMTYKNLTARIQFSAEDNLFVGRLIEIEDIVGFHAETVADLRTAFEEAVDDYLETCRQVGRPPLRLASGNLMLRVPAGGPCRRPGSRASGGEEPQSVGG